jgi:ribosomal protein L2
MYHPNVNLYKYTRKIRLLNVKIYITQGFFLIKQLKRNQPISLLEVIPGEGVKYVRSPSTYAIATKTNYKLHTMLIKLPSGVRKVFSLFSIGSPGPNPLSGTKY